MKKIITLLALSITLFSCSPDDSVEEHLEPNPEEPKELTCDCYIYQVVSSGIYFKRYYCNETGVAYPGTPPGPTNIWICP